VDNPARAGQIVPKTGGRPVEKDVMKHQFVNTLQEGDTLNDYFVATRKDLRAKQSGGKFLGMVFKDRTGDIGGILWNNAEAVAELFEVGSVVHVRGKITTYQSNLQVHVSQVSPLQEGEYDPDALVFVPEDTRENLALFREILDTVENPWLKQLAAAFFADDAFVEAFSNAAAAKKWHHAYRGGLVRHCYEMARLAGAVCELFPSIDRDVLLMGVFLHDIGKIDEMSQSLHVEYTTPGKLIGHIQMGADMLNERIRAIPGFPEPLRLHLLHLVLSHHGELEHGAPVLPKTLEAIVLHHIDNLDAQATAFSRIIQETRDKGQAWSDFLPLINRVIYTNDSDG
jgi:3'-5' exoribonuclease